MTFEDMYRDALARLNTFSGYPSGMSTLAQRLSAGRRYEYGTNCTQALNKAWSNWRSAYVAYLSTHDNETHANLIGTWARMQRLMEQINAKIKKESG